MACAEAVEKVLHWHPALHAHQVRDECMTLRHLNRLRREHDPARGAAGHDVAVIAEDAQRLGRQRPRRDMHDAWQQLTSDLEHVRDHQQQALARSEGRAECAALQCSVQGAGGPSLALHLRDAEALAVAIQEALGGPFVDHLAHGRTGRDRVNEGDVAQGVGDVSGGLVAIDAGIRALVLADDVGVVDLGHDGLVLGLEHRTLHGLRLEELLVLHVGGGAGTETLKTCGVFLHTLFLRTQTSVPPEGSGRTAKLRHLLRKRGEAGRSN
mmetsp:Transcript_117427/g.377186  ORF Transcript_117427/g.377186 Transcript_117427/m.377186 type:complete len:268 (-) Transcript_117427:49-852(-)